MGIGSARFIEATDHRERVAQFANGIGEGEKAESHDQRQCRKIES